ncbi:hypothetical protein TNCV_3896541 [Trichonephila clavipes]|nr:hypothetical protein TNCV_3896541 [Trichonephila clavipes]
MGTPTARNVAPAGSEYAETARSNHCISFVGRVEEHSDIITTHLPLFNHIRRSWGHWETGFYEIRRPISEMYLYP